MLEPGRMTTFHVTSHIHAMITTHSWHGYLAGHSVAASSNYSRLVLNQLSTLQGFVLPYI